MAKGQIESIVNYYKTAYPFGTDLEIKPSEPRFNYFEKKATTIPSGPTCVPIVEPI